MATNGVLSDHVCELGEGPTYDSATGTLWWFNIVARQLLEMKWPDGPTIVHDLPRMASALAGIDSGRQLIVMDDGLYVRDMATGSLSLHRQLEADIPANRSNDARTHPSGAFWIGTMGKAAEKGAGSIYWYRKGEIRRLYANITIPNSICFSPDGRVAYFTDTAVNAMMRVDCDPETGLPIGEPSVLVPPSGTGWIDGSVCDADGLIWNARWGGAVVNVHRPDGSLVASHQVGAGQSSCPAFCGPDAGSVAVTTAWQGMDDAARSADPGAGKLYLLPVRAKGRFDHPVAL